MCPDKYQELHEWIGVALSILLYTYSGTFLKNLSWGNGKNLCFKASKEIFNVWKRKGGNIAKAIIKAYIKTTINISSATTLTSFDLLSSTARVTSITFTKQESVIGSRKFLCTRFNSWNHKLCQYFLLHSFQKKTTLVQTCWPWACATYEWLKEITIIYISSSAMDNKPS